MRSTLCTVDFAKMNKIFHKVAYLLQYAWAYNNDSHDDERWRMTAMVTTTKTMVRQTESTTASFISELLKLRDNYWDFSGVFHLDQSGIATMIDFVATA